MKKYLITICLIFFGMVHSSYAHESYSRIIIDGGNDLRFEIGQFFNEKSLHHRKHFYNAWNYRNLDHSRKRHHRKYHMNHHRHHHGKRYHKNHHRYYHRNWQHRKWYHEQFHGDD